MLGEGFDLLQLFLRMLDLLEFPLFFLLFFSDELGRDAVGGVLGREQKLLQFQNKEGRTLLQKT